MSAYGDMAKKRLADAGYKRWKDRTYIPETHEPGKQPGEGMGKKGLKKRAAPKAGKK